MPWPPREDKLLYRRVLPKDYLALPVPKPLAGTVAAGYYNIETNAGYTQMQDDLEAVEPGTDPSG